MPNGGRGGMEFCLTDFGGLSDYWICGSLGGDVMSSGCRGKGAGPGERWLGGDFEAIGPGGTESREAADAAEPIHS